MRRNKGYNLKTHTHTHTHTHKINSYEYFILSIHLFYESYILTLVYHIFILFKKNVIVSFIVSIYKTK